VDLPRRLPHTALMDFVIVGAGALGSILGAKLLVAGHAVTLLARGARAEAVRRDGLRIHGIEDHQRHCAVVIDPSQVISTDVLIMAVKTLTHAPAAQSLAHLDVDSVFSVANGVVKNQQLIDVFGSERVVGCMANFSGELEADGRVQFTHNNCIRLGELNAPSSGRCDALVAALNGAGVNAEAVADIRSVEWSKFVGWCPFMGLSVLSGAVSEKFLSDPDHAQVLVRAVREMCQLADALGIPIDGESPLPIRRLITGSVAAGVAEVQQVGARLLEHSPDHRMSALQDLLRGTPLEVEDTLGHAVRLADELGVSMPVMGTLYGLVAGVDRQRRPRSL
jgi:2-dehydropantoate 2-reductase